MARRITYIIALLCLTALAGNAQNQKFEPEWNIGVGAGATFSSVDFANTRNVYKGIVTKSWQQIFGGISVRYITEKNLGLIAELNYSQQGWQQDFTDINTAFAHSRQLNYLELPLLTHIYFGNKVRFFANLGPKFAYLLSSKETMNQALDDYLQSGQVPESDLPTDQYYRSPDRRFDYGLMFGLGMEFRSGIGNFALEGRYYFGLSDIYNNSKSDFFARSANRVASVKLTYYVKFLK